MHHRTERRGAGGGGGDAVLGGGLGVQLTTPGVDLGHGGLHIAAGGADFNAILGGAKLPKMDTLKEEGRKLAEQKKKLYAEYRKAKADMQEVTTIKANIGYLLGYSEPGRKKEQER